MYLASVFLVLFASAFRLVARGVTIRLSVSYILGVRICVLDREDRLG
jgi:hypothetical protein